LGEEYRSRSSTTFCNILKNMQLSQTERFSLTRLALFHRCSLHIHSYAPPTTSLNETLPSRARY
jgi:hypothetical protein